MKLNLEMVQSKESKAAVKEITPTYGSDKAAAFDLRADLRSRFIKSSDYSDTVTVTTQGTVVLEAGERMLIPTGFIFKIPEGYQMNIYSRSGLSWKNGVVVVNSPAIIDEDYTDETFIILHNTSEGDFVIEHGMRIAQAQLNPVYRVELDSLGGRDGGFGSTGKR